MLTEQQIYLFGQIQTSTTWGKPYSDSTPYNECSLARGFIFTCAIERMLGTYLSTRFAQICQTFANFDAVLKGIYL